MLLELTAAGASVVLLLTICMVVGLSIICTLKQRKKAGLCYLSCIHGMTCLFVDICQLFWSHSQHVLGLLEG